jgi:hypothetical protein
MDLRLYLVGGVLITACGSESERPHERAGRRVHECTTVAGHLAPGAGSPRRATWAANIIGDGRSHFDLPVRASWTYAMDGDVPDAASACVDIEKVPPDLSIEAIISVHVIQVAVDDHASIKLPHVLIDLALVLRAPARTKDGVVISNHPEAKYVWRFESRHDSLNAYQFQPLTIPDFQPPWHGVDLKVDPVAIGVERIVGK